MWQKESLSEWGWVGECVVGWGGREFDGVALGGCYGTYAHSQCVALPPHTKDRAFQAFLAKAAG